MTRITATIVASIQVTECGMPKVSRTSNMAVVPQFCEPALSPMMSASAGSSRRIPTLSRKPESRNKPIETVAWNGYSWANHATMLPNPFCAVWRSSDSDVALWGKNVIVFCVFPLG